MTSIEKVFNNKDLVNIILSFRNLQDNRKSSGVNKTIYDCSHCVIKNQIQLKRFFITFKSRTFFKKNRKPKTYYTFKNKYINREETPLMLFIS